MGTDGNDCSVQFFDNRIACDGPNAILRVIQTWYAQEAQVLALVSNVNIES